MATHLNFRTVVVVWFERDTFFKRLKIRAVCRVNIGYGPVQSCAEPI